MPDQKRRDALIEQFKELYGDKPKTIKIMFPPAAPELFFAQFYKRYGTGALLKCKGDGEVAETTEDFAQGLEKIGETERGFIQVVCKGPECPYQISNECGRIAALQVILPELSGIGVWQINTGSYNSIVNINSAIEWLTGLCGRYAMIPVNLMRQAQDIAYEGKRSKHYVLAIDQNISIGEIQRFASITTKENALIPGPDDKKDDLFYDENGKRGALPAPDIAKEALGAPINDDLKSAPLAVEGPIMFEDGSTKTPKAAISAPVSKTQGPISAAFDEDQKARAQMRDLQEGLKTCKTLVAVKDYCKELKDKGYIDKLPVLLRDELREWTAAYMKGLKS